MIDFSAATGLTLQMLHHLGKVRDAGAVGSFLKVVATVQKHTFHTRPVRPGNINLVLVANVHCLCRLDSSLSQYRLEYFWMGFIKRESKRGEASLI